MRPPARLARHPAGFAYIVLLVAVAVSGAALGLAGSMWSTAAQREREAELLFVGEQFRRAIASYYDASSGTKQFPARLEDLLSDQRLPATRRHLRRLYPDPMSGSPDWGLVKHGDRIVGVYSKSTGVPIKRAHFGRDDLGFEGAATYSDWRFVYLPGGRDMAAGSSTATAAAAAGGAVRADAATSASDAAVAAGVRSPPASRPAPPPTAVPREAWTCVAQRANDLRDCEALQSGNVGSCRERATARYGACIRSSATAALSPGE